MSVARIVRAVPLAALLVPLAAGVLIAGRWTAGGDESPSGGPSSPTAAKKLSQNCGTVAAATVRMSREAQPRTAVPQTKEPKSTAEGGCATNKGGGPSSPAVAKSDGPWEVPAEAAEKKNPVPSDEKSVAAGKTVYTRQCAACHGEKGKGDGPAAIALKTKPGDLSESAMWKQTDGALFYKITEGRGSMASYRKLLTDEQRWQAVNFIRTLAKKP